MSKIFNILIPLVLMIFRGEKIIYPDYITPLACLSGVDSKDGH